MLRFGEFPKGPLMGCFTATILTPKW